MEEKNENKKFVLFKGNVDFYKVSTFKNYIDKLFHNAIGIRPDVDYERSVSYFNEGKSTYSNDYSNETEITLKFFIKSHNKRYYKDPYQCNECILITNDEFKNQFFDKETASKDCFKDNERLLFISVDEKLLSEKMSIFLFDVLSKIKTVTDDDEGEPVTFEQGDW